MTEAVTETALFELLSLECRVGTDGTVHYYNSTGKLHRVHGPAIACPDGDREWWQNGQLHRLGGPAIEYTDGSRAWFQNGWLHRMDGPAIVNADGGCEWFINGNELTEAEWQQVVANMDPV